MVGFKYDALEVDLGAFGLVGKWSVEVTYLLEGCVGPVRARGGIGEFDSLGQQDHMLGDRFCSIEVLSDQGWGHDQGGSGIGKAFSSGAIGREFFGRLDVLQEGKVFDRVGVFGVIEPSQQDRTRVAGIALGLKGQPSFHPADGDQAIGFCWLRFLFGWHLLRLKLFEYPLNRSGIALDGIPVGPLGQVDIGLGPLGVVAFGAVFMNKRLNRGWERAFEFFLAWIGNQRMGGLPRQSQQQSECPEELSGA